MIELLKQMVEALETPNAGLVAYEGEWRSIQSIAIQAGLKAIAELESQEPVAWRTFDGEGGHEYRAYEENENYADDWNKRNPNHKSWVEPLYTHPSQRTEQEPCAKHCEATAFKIVVKNLQGEIERMKTAQRT